MQPHLRLLPAVDRVLGAPEVAALCDAHGRATVTNYVRNVLDELRAGAADQLPDNAPDMEEEVVRRVSERAGQSERQRLRRVINGTGIVLHTNLGRAPLAKRAVEAIAEVAAGANLEVDLETGQRGRRGAAVESLLRELTGAEAALVVNNCAAATLLTLQTVAAGRDVVISRGQLIEIGGAFRLPDVFRQAGVKLVEVGTTNRTRLADYAAAIHGETAALLRVHPSNYRISGFSESTSIGELAALGKEADLPAIDDVGSGCLYDLARYGLADEPIVADSLRAGASLVLFSGDKLLGGPQCGIIVGGRELVDRLRSNPLTRALRVDKLTFAALQATLEIHRAGRAFEEIPALQQLALTEDDLRPRAVALLAQLNAQSAGKHRFSIRSVDSAAGGGSLPDQTLPSLAIRIIGENATELAARLRRGNPAVLSRIVEDEVLIDLRTVMPDDDDALVGRLVHASQARREST
ncbi:MAG: L-seryl-tRNA(Sec) selenium transferase [Planctomycetaceae bacterium]|nr:L-seryl-tRNA(Sec) selenium transferase [Planctomycetaceae bacterium]